MRFLKDYPTLHALEKAYPLITKGTFERILASTNESAALAAVPAHIRHALLQKYSPGEVLYGIRILLGVGKGKNNRYSSLMLLNGVIFKYGARGDSEPSRRVQNRMAICVGRARQMALNAAQVLDSATARQNTPGISSSVLQQVLFHHFGTSSGLTDQVKSISATYQRIWTGLSDHIIIADLHPARDNEGFVRWKMIYRDAHPPKSIPSPFRTCSVKLLDDENAQLVSDLRSLPGSEVMGMARQRGIRATSVEAAIMTLMTRRSSSIHIDFRLADDSGDRRWTDLGIATVILHEASHKFAGTYDHTYCRELRYQSLAGQMKRSNADSYAYAAASFHNGSLIKDFSDSAISR